MEKILLFNVRAPLNIIKSAANMKVQSVVVSPLVYDNTLEVILEKSPVYRTGDAIPEYNDDDRSMIVFCNLSDRHMDKLLFEIRKGAANVDYKAVLTDTNKKWHFRRMLAQMEREKRSIAENK